MKRLARNNSLAICVEDITITCPCNIQRIQVSAVKFKISSEFFFFFFFFFFFYLLLLKTLIVGTR